jgi:hypothetical protein
MSLSLFFPFRLTLARNQFFTVSEKHLKRLFTSHFILFFGQGKKIFTRNYSINVASVPQKLFRAFLSRCEKIKMPLFSLNKY